MRISAFCRSVLAVILSLTFLATWAPACSSGGRPPMSRGIAEGFGTVGLSLVVASGVSVDRVDWTLHNPSVLPADLTGSVDISRSSKLEFVVGGLPEGTGYAIALTATTSDGLACSGSASFGIAAAVTTSATVDVVCGGTGVDGGDNGSVVVSGVATVANECAAVSSLSASPSTATVGGSIRLSAQGVDSTGSSADVVFAWAVAGGSGRGAFSSTTSASPSFTCTAAGPVTLTVAASVPDGGAMCTGNTATVALDCTPSIPESDGGGASEGGRAVRPAATAVAAGAAFACALLSEGTVECWGASATGELGNGTTIGPVTCSAGSSFQNQCSPTPVPVQGLSGVTAIAAGAYFACALLSDGTVACWGDDGVGELGNGSATGLEPCSGSPFGVGPCSSRPVAVPGLTGVTAIAAGGYFACALLSGGTVACWGENVFGELGVGTLTGPDSCIPGDGYPVACSRTPVAVPGLTGVTALAADFYHACALEGGGTAECWGSGYSGELGNGVGKTSPTPVSSQAVRRPAGATTTSGSWATGRRTAPRHRSRSWA
jgi:hypothetical protein